MFCWFRRGYIHSVIGKSLGWGNGFSGVNPKKEIYTLRSCYWTWVSNTSGSTMVELAIALSLLMAIVYPIFYYGTVFTDLAAWKTNLYLNARDEALGNKNNF